MESEGAAVSIKQAVTNALQAVLDGLPALLAAAAIVFAGWLLARLARRAARHLAGGANRLLERTLRRGTAATARLSPAFISLTGELAFWLVLVFAVIVAASVAGLGGLGESLNNIVRHLPNMIVGAAIIVVGYFLSVYLRELVSSSAESGQVAAATVLGRLAQGAALAVAIIIGLDQAGVDVAVLLILFAIGLGGTVAAVVLAFGLGARDHVGNLIGARNARDVIHPGVRLRIGEVEGEVIELSHTHVALDTSDGKLLVPARALERERVLIIAPAADEARADG
jgi:cytochrome c biogenesis protein CcdA